MKTSEKIKTLRQQKGISQEALGELVGVKKAAINKYETGRVVNIKRSTLQKLADALGVLPADLLDDPETPSSTTITSSEPIYEVAAGPGRICSTPTGTMSIQLRDDQFLATVKGRSMEPTLFDGDTVVIDRQSVPDQDGQIVMVKVDGEENTLKRVQIGENGITLIADNPSVFPTKFYTAEQVKDLPVQIMGVVTKLIRDI